MLVHWFSKLKLPTNVTNLTNLTNFATNTAFTAVENKIPNVGNLVKETDYNTKISEMENKITADQGHDKYITAAEFNKLTAEHLT